VKTADLGPPPSPATILAYATIVPPWNKQTVVSSRLAGRVASIAVRPGDRVESGALVAELESTELLALQTEWLSIHNSRRQAEQLVKTLEGSGPAIAGQALLDAQNQLRQSENLGVVTRAKWTALGLPLENLDLLRNGTIPASPKFPIRAAISGTVSNIALSAGQNVEVGRPLMTITDLSTVWVKIGLLESDLNSIEAGRKCELRFPAIHGEEFSVPIKQIGSALDPETRLGTAWAEMSNPLSSPPQFIPGMFGEARIALAENKGTKSIPTTALIDDGVDRFVFVEGASTKGTSEYLRRSIELVRSNSTVAEIRTGELVPGDRVVTRGSHQLGGYFAPNTLRLTPTMTRNLSVRVEPVAAHAIDDILELFGRVELPSDRRSSASSALAGILERIYVDRNQFIRAGQLVAEVFSSDLSAIELDLLKEHLAGKLLMQQLQDARSLGTAVSKKRLIELEFASKESRLRQDSLRRRLQLLGLSTEQLTALEDRNQITPLLPIRANQDGIVVHLESALGRGIRADETIVIVHDPRSLWVQGLVPESDLNRMEMGNPVRIRTASRNSPVFSGLLVRRSPEVTAHRAVVVWAELDATASPLPRHDQLARMVVVTGRGSPVTTVPRDAIVKEGRQAFVFVRLEDGTFERRPVELGRADDLHVEVLSGLRLGEPIVIAAATALQTAYASVR